MHCLAPHPIKEIKETTRTHQPLYFHAGNILQPAAPENMACRPPLKKGGCPFSKRYGYFPQNSFLYPYRPYLNFFRNRWVHVLFQVYPGAMSEVITLPFGEANEVAPQQ